MDKQRILIIEDDPTIVLGLRDALSFEGYEILSAATCEEGVSLAHNSNPDAVVLGGGLSNIDALYLELPPRIERYAFSDALDLRLVKNQHGDSSGVRGAAWLHGLVG